MKKLFTILFLSVCFVSVPSCQKDNNGKGDDPNRLLNLIKRYMRYLLQINKTQIMRFYLLTINLLLIWGFAQGQDLRLLDGLGHGGIGVRFLTEV
ncbi:MAG: hypothetical protein J5604_00685, partial [Bacteroidales bacterium]|nr:hypothetical protein [Bacteroidales bacterium]